MRAALRNPEVVHRRRWITLVVLCVSLLVIILDNSILNVALPTLARARGQGGIGASESSLQWIVDAYTLVFAGLLLTAGSLGDKFGRYGALALGLAIFGSTSAASAFSHTPTQLITYRALMGIGGAFIMPATLSILTNVFRDPQERGRAIGVWAGISGIGIGLGPVTGGFLLRHFWWGSVLLVNVPFVVIGLVAGFFFVPSSKDPASPRLDPLGALLSIVGLGTLLWAVIEGPTRGWTSSAVITGFVAGIVLLVLFMWWEVTTKHPMLNIRFFKNPRFSAASGSITLTFMALFGVIFLLTQYLQSVQGFSPLKAGAILIPQSLVILVLAPTSSRFVEMVGTKVVVGVGLLITALSLVIFATFSPDTGLLAIIGGTMVLGLGMSNVMAPATESIMGSLPRSKAGVGSAINDTTRQVGGAIGVALLGSLLSSRYLSHLHDAMAGSGLPPATLRGAETNIQAAVEVSKHAPAPLGQQLLDTAKDAFMSGMHLAVVVAAGIVVVAAVGVFLWLPARAPSEAEVERFAEAIDASEDAPVAGFPLPVGAE